MTCCPYYWSLLSSTCNEHAQDVFLTVEYLPVWLSYSMHAVDSPEIYDLWLIPMYSIVHLFHIIDAWLPFVGGFYLVERMVGFEVVLHSQAGAC